MITESWRRIGGATALVLSLSIVGPAVAAALEPDAKLYELTENMKFTKGKVTHRVAKSELMGFAPAGSALCPKELGIPVCALNSTGVDNINTATGKGEVSGTYTGVVQGDNPFDGPELVIGHGQFHGKMDFSPALLVGIPYGTIKGKTSNNFGGGRATFQGVFRLPFAGNIPIPELGGATLRQAFCPLTPDKNPFTDVYGGLDLAYVDTLPNGTLTGRCIDIQPNELSLGTPTVRFDIYFD